MSVTCWLKDCSELERRRGCYRGRIRQAHFILRARSHARDCHVELLPVLKPEPEELSAGAKFQIGLAVVVLKKSNSAEYILGQIVRSEEEYSQEKEAGSKTNTRCHSIVIERNVWRIEDDCDLQWIALICLDRAAPVAASSAGAALEASVTIDD